MCRSPVIVPDCIEILGVALGAGRAGRPVVVGLRGYSAPVRGVIERWLSSQNADNENVQVFADRDVRRVFDRQSLPRVIVLEDSSLAECVASRLGGYGWKGGETATAPVVIASADEGISEQPVATIVLDADRDELDAIEKWRWGESCYFEQPNETDQTAVQVDLSVAIRRAVFLSGAVNIGNGAVMAEQLVIEALMVGACVCRHDTQPIDGKMAVNVDDFDAVRTLIRRVAARTPDEFSDPLATAMVWRGNLYLRARAARCTRSGKSARLDHSDELGVNGAHEITRRELVDLGSTNGRIVGDLIEFLADTFPNGGAQDSVNGTPTTRRGWLRAIGLVRDLPEWWRWPDADAAKVIRPLLRRWTQKQVRTHFDRLRKAGTITGSRESGNAPWVYRLPESFTPTPAFSWLPTTDEVRRAAEDDLDQTDARASAPSAPRLPAVVGSPNA